MTHIRAAICDSRKSLIVDSSSDHSALSCNYCNESHHSIYDHDTNESRSIVGKVWDALTAEYGTNDDGNLIVQDDTSTNGILSYLTSFISRVESKNESW